MSEAQEQSNLSASEIRERIHVILSEIVGVSEDEIAAAASFEDLGLDSLAQTELVVEIEDEFSIQVMPIPGEDSDPEESARNIKSVDQAVARVQELQQAKTKAIL